MIQFINNSNIEKFVYLFYNFPRNNSKIFLNDRREINLVKM